MDTCKFLTATALVAVLSIPTIANAAIISVDYQSADDNLITRDTSSGLDWLDLTETNNMSYNMVLSQLGSGGLFEEFRYASSIEAIELWANFGVDLAPDTTRSLDFIDPGIFMATSYLGNLFNGVYSTEYLYGLYGITGTLREPSTNRHDIVGAYVRTSEISAYKNSLWGPVPDDDGYRMYAGSYLVRVSPVPIPASIWLFTTGLISLVSFARRKTNA